MEDITEIGQTISIDGGLSGNPWFCQFLADVLQKTVTVQSGKELTAFGTAMMAAVNTTINKSESVKQASYATQNSHNEYKLQFAKAVSRCRNW